MYYINNICCLCLSEENELKLVYQENQKLNTIVQHVLPQIPFHSIQIPTYVCTSCFTNLDAFYAYQEECIKTYYQWKQYIQKLQMKNDGLYKDLKIFVFNNTENDEKIHIEFASEENADSNIEENLDVGKIITEENTKNVDKEIIEDPNEDKIPICEICYDDEEDKDDCIFVAFEENSEFKEGLINDDQETEIMEIVTESQNWYQNMTINEETVKKEEDSDVKIVDFKQMEENEEMKSEDMIFDEHETIRDIKEDLFEEIEDNNDALFHQQIQDKQEALDRNIDYHLTEIVADDVYMEVLDSDQKNDELNQENVQNNEKNMKNDINNSKVAIDTKKDEMSEIQKEIPQKSVKIDIISDKTKVVDTNITKNQCHQQQNIPPSNVTNLNKNQSGKTKVVINFVRSLRKIQWEQQQKNSLPRVEDSNYKITKDQTQIDRVQTENKCDQLTNVAQSDNKKVVVINFNSSSTKNVCDQPRNIILNRVADSNFKINISDKTQVNINYDSPQTKNQCNQQLTNESNVQISESNIKSVEFSSVGEKNNANSETNLNEPLQIKIENTDESVMRFNRSSDCHNKDFPLFRCMFCSKSFQNLKETSSHLKTHKVLTCAICIKEKRKSDMFNVAEIKAHARSVHSSSKFSLGKVKMQIFRLRKKQRLVKCKKCNKMCTNLKEHTHEYNTIICEKCNVIIPLNDYTKHMETRHFQYFYVPRCFVCLRKFNYLYRLFVHFEVVHFDINKCPLCYTTLNNRYNLIDHMKKHDEQYKIRTENYSLDYIDCLMTNSFPAKRLKTETNSTTSIDSNKESNSADINSNN